MILTFASFLLLPIVLDIVNPPPPPCVEFPAPEEEPFQPRPTQTHQPKPEGCVPSGGMFGTNAFLHNFDNYLFFLPILYFISCCLACFGSGFFLGGEEPQAPIWQSLVVGLFVGMSIPIYFFATGDRFAPMFILFLGEVIMNEVVTANEVITAFVYSFITSVVGLFGFYMARRIYHPKI